MKKQKQAYYFSHDANARRDPKIQEMLMEYGAKGYGWYWMLIEMMREQSDYTLSIGRKVAFEILAKELGSTAKETRKFVGDCIQKFKLFESEGESFWSNSLKKRMLLMEENNQKRAASARKRWDNDSNPEPGGGMRTHSERTANAVQRKEIKEKETKPKEGEREGFFLPHDEQVQKLCEALEEERGEEQIKTQQKPKHMIPTTSLSYDPEEITVDKLEIPPEDCYWHNGSYFITWAYKEKLDKQYGITQEDALQYILNGFPPDDDPNVEVPITKENLEAFLKENAKRLEEEYIDISPSLRRIRDAAQ